MRIYDFSLFLLIFNLLAAFFCAAGIVPVNLQTVAISSEDIKEDIPSSVEYSNADIGLYAFGDFPRALGMLAKLFVYSPIILCLLMTQAGINPDLVEVVKTIFLAVYLVGLAQIIMRFSVKEGA